MSQAQVGPSHGLAFVTLAANATRERSRTRRQRLLDNVLNLAVQGLFKFRPGDVRPVLRAVGRHDRDDAAMALYSRAVSAGNISLCAAVEAHLKFRPMFLDGHRVCQGSSLFWRGAKASVSSLELEADAVRLAFYEGSHRPKRYLTVTRAEIAEEERRRRKAAGLAGLRAVLSDGAPVVLWGPTAEGHAEPLRWACAVGVDVVRTEDEAEAVDALLGASSMRRVRRQLVASVSAGTGRSWAEASGDVTVWSFACKGEDGPRAEVRLPADPDSFGEDLYDAFLKAANPHEDRFMNNFDLVLRTAGSRGRRRRAALLRCCLQRSGYDEPWAQETSAEEGGVRCTFTPKTAARRPISVFVPRDPAAFDDALWREALAAAAEFGPDDVDALADADGDMAPVPPGMLVAWAPVPRGLERAARDAGAYVLSAPKPLRVGAALDVLRERLFPQEPKAFWRERGKFLVAVRSQRRREIADAWADTGGLRYLGAEWFDRDDGARWSAFLFASAAAGRRLVLVAEEGDDAAEEAAAGGNGAVTLIRLNPCDNARLAANDAGWQLFQTVARWRGAGGDGG